MRSVAICILIVILGVVSAFQRPALIAHKSGLFSSSPTALFSSRGGGGDGDSEKKKAVIVGGGPVGLATALTLSNAPHFYDITLVEQAPQASGYDPTKAYLYLVNPRGQTWTKSFPRVQELLAERGSVNTGMGNLVLVPGDPEEPIPDKIPPTPGAEPSYWISRHTMVELLEEVIQEQETDRKKERKTDIGSIEVLPCKQCMEMKALEDGRVEVVVMDTQSIESRFQQSFEADLVVGADGMNSVVRGLLANPPRDAHRSWLTASQKKFQTKTWSSAASGLRMKVLQFPPGFVIPPDTKTTSETTYAIRSVNKGPKDYVSLGLLPVKDPNMVRPTNVITRPNHDVWKLKTGEEIKAWFTKAFPRLDLNSLIDDAEWERFAGAQGTTFPKCQFCSGMQLTSVDGDKGVVLVGDAIHAFPPDIGQGINAGFADVVSFDRALQGKDIVTGNDLDKKPSNLAESLKTYEKVRAPEIAALIRLSRFGSPYQYRQPLYRDRAGRILWSLNVAFRMLLNKVLKVPPACIMGAMDKSVTYRRLMRQSDITTVALWSIVALVVQRIWGASGVLVGSLVPTALWFLTYWFGK